MFTAREILDIALKIEQNGEAIYRKAVKALSQPHISERLSWMADEEARHMEWFKKLQDDEQHRDKGLAVDEMSTDMLRSLVGEQSFTLKDVNFSDVKNLSDLIDIFIEFERDGILFYEMLRAFVKDLQVLESLDQIIAEEYRHIETLEALKPSNSQV